MERLASGIDPWRAWSQDSSHPPADWATVRAVSRAARELIGTLDVMLADIGAAGPRETQDATFLLRGMLEVADNLFCEVVEGAHRAGQTVPPVTGDPITVVCDVDGDPPELLVVLTVPGGKNPYHTVDALLTDAGVLGVTPMLAFHGDITSLVTAGSGLRILRIPD
ncbi:hypothetical protein AB0M47_05100 [Hamadaea sp. NPDC051192]|uniref:hypothetical protein n=1 Tax=Hamadaea sp. NPDC051192 TaxID=3154940 RepID=UPI00343A407C